MFDNTAAVYSSSLSSDLLKDVHGLRIRVSSSQPLLVHCSNGAGMSGVFVLMEYLMAIYDAGEVRG